MKEFWENLVALFKATRGLWEIGGVYLLIAGIFLVIGSPNIWGNALEVLIIVVVLVILLILFAPKK